VAKRFFSSPLAGSSLVKDLDLVSFILGILYAALECVLRNLEANTWGRRSLALNEEACVCAMKEMEKNEGV